MRQFLSALKFSFKEQFSNKFAFGLLVVFVPLWYALLGAIASNDPVGFKFQPSGRILGVSGHNLILITAGLNVLSMILGFMFFHSAHRSLEFDKRLTRAGLSRPGFVAAKSTALFIVTAAISLFTALMMMVFWHFPHNIFEVWLGMWLISLIYGALGMLLGMLLNNELVGFFIVIMFSLTDTMLQNPIGNPAANKQFLQYLPSFSSMQLTATGGFTHDFAGKQLAIGIVWFVTFLLVALLIFYARTRRKSSVVQVS